MKLIKTIVVFFVVLNTVGSSLMVPLIHLDFELRRDYISKVLCINRAKPITVCGGKCYLDKKLKKATEEQQKEPKSNNRLLELSFFSQELANLVFDYPFAARNLNYPITNSISHIFSFIGGVFRPPQYT